MKNKIQQYIESPREKASREKNALKEANSYKRAINKSLKEISKIIKENFGNFEIYKNLGWFAPNILRQNLCDIQLIKKLIEKRSKSSFDEALTSPKNKTFFKQSKIKH